VKLRRTLALCGLSSMWVAGSAGATCPKASGPDTSADAFVSMDRTETRRPLVIVDAQYPPEALEECLSGWVALRFFITADGDVLEPEILASSRSGGVLEAQGLRTVRKWKFAPARPDDAPASSGGCAFFFFHHPANPLAREAAGDPFPIACPFGNAAREHRSPRGPVEVVPLWDPLDTE
jgi:TonB family protein